MPYTSAYYFDYCTSDDTRFTLTKRESQIFELLGQGFPLKQIARALGISTGTVAVMSNRLYLKLNVPSRYALVRLYLIVKKHNIDIPCISA